MNGVDGFDQESLRLWDALGRLTDGGVIEAIQPIGANSVPGLPPSPCVDMGMAMWPFPLEASTVAILQDLGYEGLPNNAAAPEQRFLHASGRFQLFCNEYGEQWMRHLLVRDYLRHHRVARQALAAVKQADWATPADQEATKACVFRELLEQAQRWWPVHTGFAPVEAVVRALSDFPRPWYVSGGWALDLFLGAVGRVHVDVDVVVARSDQLALQEYMSEHGWGFVKVVERRLEPWPRHQVLERPLAQVFAYPDGVPIDFGLGEIAAGVWRYKHDLQVLRSVERMGLRTPAGVPFLAPELALLFKSRHGQRPERPKDQADFERVHPHLEPERRGWLRWALLATNPTHPWIERLA